MTKLFKTKSVFILWLLIAMLLPLLLSCQADGEPTDTTPPPQLGQAATLQMPWSSTIVPNAFFIDKPLVFSANEQADDTIYINLHDVLTKYTETYLTDQRKPTDITALPVYGYFLENTSLIFCTFEYEDGTTHSLFLDVLDENGALCANDITPLGEYRFGDRIENHFSMENCDKAKQYLLAHPDFQALGVTINCYSPFTSDGILSRFSFIGKPADSDTITYLDPTTDKLHSRSIRFVPLFTTIQEGQESWKSLFTKTPIYCPDNILQDETSVEKIEHAVWYFHRKYMEACPIYELNQSCNFVGGQGWWDCYIYFPFFNEDGELDQKYLLFHGYKNGKLVAELILGDYETQTVELIERYERAVVYSKIGECDNNAYPRPRPVGSIGESVYEKAVKTLLANADPDKEILGIGYDGENFNLVYKK